MKIDAIVGNPPYQVISNSDNQNRNPPIFHKFVQLSIHLSPEYFSLITPARWYSSNILMGDFPHEFLSDRRISYLHDFTNANEIFPTVEIKSGVSYFLWHKRHNDVCTIDSTIERKTERSKRFLLSEYDDIFIRYNLAIPIIGKITALNETSFSTIVSPQNPFGFNTAVRGEDKITEDSIKIFSKGLTEKNIKRSSISLHKDWIDQYKIITPKASEDGILPGKVISTCTIIDPKTCCNGTYIVIGPFESKEKGKIIVKYLSTKFVRFLVGMKKMTQDLKDQTFSLVPLQDFTKNSDIDWKKSIKEIDEQLFKKYALTNEEIQFIESMIKPME